MRTLLLVIGLSLVIPFFGRGQVVLVDHTSGQQGASVVAQQFELAYSQFSSYGAEDVIVPAGQQWHLDSVLIFGEYATPSGSPTPGAGIIISLMENNAGQPGNVLYTDTLLSGADPDGDGTLFYHWDEPFVMNPGSYWLVVAARKDYGTGQTQWQWFSSSITSGDTAMWVNPGNGFTLNNCPNWNEVTTCYGSIYEGLSLTLYGCPEAKPEVFGLPLDTFYCSNSDVVISVGASSSSAVFEWSSGSQSDSVIIDQSGSYFLTVTDTVSGCAVVDSVWIEEKNAPSPQIDDLDKCPGASIVVDGYACDSCAQLWSDGSSMDSLWVSQPGLYWLQVTDTTSGCMETDTFLVEILEVDPIQYTNDPPFTLCEGGSTTIEISNNYTAYSWSTGSTGNSTEVYTPGFVTVTVTDNNGCELSDTLFVFILVTVATITITGYTEGGYQLSANPGFSSYLWSTGDTTQSITTEGGSIWLQATSSYGCQGSDTLFLAVGVDEQSSVDLRVYPNPVNGELYIDFGGESSEGRIILSTLDGRRVIQRKTQSVRETIDVNSIPSGVYMLTVETQRESWTRRIIIQNHN